LDNQVVLGQSVGLGQWLADNQLRVVYVCGVEFSFSHEMHIILPLYEAMLFVVYVINIYSKFLHHLLSLLCCFILYLLKTFGILNQGAPYNGVHAIGSVYAYSLLLFVSELCVLHSVCLSCVCCCCLSELCAASCLYQWVRLFD
jgi:hypothetical protein